MAYSLDVSDVADAEADQVYEWIAEDSPERAARWYRGLWQKCELLKQSPLGCELAPENDFFEKEVRQLLYGKRRGVYRILYNADEETQTITILHIRHAARQFLYEQQEDIEDSP